MSELEKLQALRRADRVLDLEEIIEGDVQELWVNAKKLGYTDEELRAALASLAANEYLRRRANAVTDEHIREVRRQRRLAGDIKLPLLRANRQPDA